MKKLTKLHSIYLSLFLSASLTASGLAQAAPSRPLAELNNGKVLANAMQLIRAGYYQDASRALAALVARQTGNSEAHYWLGVSYARSGKVDQALQHLQQAIELDPQNRQFRLELANTWVDKGELDKAEAEYGQLLSEARDTQDKKNIRRLLDLVKGQRYINHKNLQAALNHYQVMVQMYPDEVLALEALGHIYTQLGLWEEAETYFYRATDLAPQRAITRRRMASMYEKMGNTDARRQQLLQAIQLDPRGPTGQQAKNALLQHGLAALAKNKLDQALAEYRMILQAEPDNLAAHFAIAEAYEKTKNYNRAKSVYTRLRKEYPGNLEVQMRLAQLYHKTENIDAAIALYQHIVKTTPDSPRTRDASAKLNLLYVRKAEYLSNKLASKEDLASALDIVESWISSGQIDTAEWLLNQVLEKFPKNAKAHYFAGLVHEKRGNLKLALDSLSHSAWLDAQDLQTRIAQANVLAKTGDLSAAEAVYRDVIAQSTEPAQKAQSKKTLGLIVGEKLVRDGKAQQALSHYRQMQRDYPRDAALLQRIADIYASLNNLPAAESTLKEIAQLKKKFRHEKKVLAQGRNLVQQGKLRQAERQLLSLTESDTGNAEAYYWLGVIYAQLGETDNALEFMQASLDLAPANTGLRTEFARLQVKAGQLEKAQDQYEKILGQVSGTSNRKEIKRLLEFVKGQQLLNAAEMQQALTHFQTMRMMFPQDIAVLEAYASVCMQLELWTEAQETYQRVLALDSTRTITHIRLAEVFAQKDEQPNRLRHLKLAIKADPNSKVAGVAANILLKQGGAYLKNDDFPAALKEFKAVLSVQPSHYQANLAVADAYARQNRLEDAKKIYQSLVVLHPVDMSARSKLAELYVQTENLDEALNEYQKIYDLAPSTELGQNANAKLNFLYGRKAEEMSTHLHDRSQQKKAMEMAQRWISKDRLDAAQWLLAAIQEQNPDLAESYYWLGQIQKKRGNLQAATEYFSNSSKLEPRNPEYLLGYANSLAAQGRVRQAESVYVNVITLAQKDNATRRDAQKHLGYLVGERLFQEGKYQAALDHYQKLQAKDAQETELMERTAGVLIKLQRPREAEALYRRALEIDPSSAPVNIGLAKLYKQQGQNKAYLKQLRNVFVLDRTGGMGQHIAQQLGLNEGLKQLHKGRWKAAAVAFQRTLEADPNNLFAKVGISAAYQESGLKEQADRTLHDVLKLDTASLETRMRFLMLKTNYAQQ